jgi:preprotein translocase SecE subunit
MELAMAVAEKTLEERAPRNPERELAFSSLLGGLYVLASLWIVFAGWWKLWSELFPSTTALSVADALLLIVLAGTAVGELFFGLYLEKVASPPRGFRAGTFIVCVAALFILWITDWIGGLLAEQEMGGFGIALTLAVVAGLIFAMTRIFFRPGFSRSLVHLEDQGWFHASSYKPNQGVRVRRFTMLAFLVLGACGIWVMIMRKALGSDVLGTGNHWELTLPFTLDSDTGVYRYFPLVYQVHYTIPLTLIVLLIWLSWRVVNWPAFTDFLIATEAEMNKVSWTSRRRLFQDTIVVLVTVFLLTVFLFAIDLLWIKALTSVQVLKVDMKAEQMRQQEKSQW